MSLKGGGMKRGGQLFAATTAAALMMSGVASAALTYDTESEELPAGESETTVAACAGAEKITGGGLQVSSGALLTDVGSSNPLDALDDGLAPDDLWVARGNNGTDDDTSQEVTAICSTTGSFRYRSESRTVPIFTQRSASVDCPADTEVSGGGFHISGNDVGTQAESSFPRSNGWKAVANNLSNSLDDEELTVFAICAENGSYVTRSKTFDVFPNIQTGASRRCPFGTRVSGGGAKVAGETLTSLNTIAPVDSNADQDTLPDDRFLAWINNGSDADRVATVYAICKH